MATIKTNTTNASKRIITKTQNGVKRVSCSCCGEEGCCMYAAEDGYGAGLITNGDLPDEVELYFSSAGPNPEDNFLIGPAIATYNGNATWGSFNGGNGPYVYFGSGWVSVYAESGPAGPAECLFADKLNDPPIAGQGRVYVFDRFEDTYTISGGDGSFVVERTGLCTWEGENGVLYYAGGGFDAVGQGSFVWRSTFFEQNGAKQGNQNTPVGTYQDEISLATWTVS